MLAWVRHRLTLIGHRELYVRLPGGWLVRLERATR